MGWFGGVAALLITVASGILVHLVLTKQSLQVHARPFIALIHLLATVLSSGVQLWTTFAFGLIAFKHLPRHVFGNLQGNLFPVYFTVVSVCTVLQLLAVYWLTDSLESSTPARVQFQVGRVDGMRSHAPSLPSYSLQTTLRTVGVAGSTGGCVGKHHCVWYVSG